MKRAQAALEFLTTYGWAFLVILVMIGALAYFGVLNPSRFLPERCNVGPEFTCNEYQIVNSIPGVLSMIFTNNVGETISGVTVTDAKWAQEDLAGGAGCAVTYPDVGGVPGTSAKAGDPITVVCSFTNSGDTAFPPVGSKMKFNIDISYLPQGKTYTKPLTAEVFTTLKPSP